VIKSANAIRAAPLYLRYSNNF